MSFIRDNAANEYLKSIVLPWEKKEKMNQPHFILSTNILFFYVLRLFEFAEDSFSSEKKFQKRSNYAYYFTILKKNNLKNNMIKNTYIIQSIYFFLF